MIYSLTSGQSATPILPCRRACIHTCKLSTAIDTYTTNNYNLTTLLAKTKMIKLQHCTKQTTNTVRTTIVCPIYVFSTTILCSYIINTLCARKYECCQAVLLEWPPSEPAVFGQCVYSHVCRPSLLCDPCL